MPIDLDAVKNLKVLFIGDRIVDKYIYVTTIGKAVKENALSTLFMREETFYGGVLAASAHLKSFCSHVTYRGGDRDMVNTRIVDDVYLRKLIVLHESRPSTERNDPVDIGSYDVVVVTDFGHGSMSKELIDKVSREARFLCVNAQTNATNFGFNLITKYPRADFVVIDELEARLAAHDKVSPIEDVILELGFKKIIVTRGVHGAIGFDGAFERQEGLTDKVVDTMGAGDAFLAVTSPFAAVGFSMKDLIRIGNAAGAIKVGIVGHRESVTKKALADKLDINYFSGAAGVEPWGPKYV